MHSSIKIVRAVQHICRTNQVSSSAINLLCGSCLFNFFFAVFFSLRVRFLFESIILFLAANKMKSEHRSEQAGKAE